MSGLITAAVIAAGGAVAAGAMQNSAAKKAANAQRNGVQTFDPIEPNAPQTVDWRRVVSDALNFNNNQYGKAANLAAQNNRFNTRAALQQYSAMQPYFRQLQGQIGQNALSYSRGDLPQDVVDSIGRAAAQRGLQGGFAMGARGAGAGTPLSALNLRNLGLTSLDLSKFGTQLAMGATSQARSLSPGLTDALSMLPTPQQQVGYEWQNTQTMNEADRYWNQVQNQALMGNTGAQNAANQNATNTELAGQLAQAQAIAQAASSIGGVATTYGQRGGYVPQTQGAPSGGPVAGYGYRPSTGYYPLA